MKYFITFTYKSGYIQEYKTVTSLKQAKTIIMDKLRFERENNHDSIKIGSIGTERGCVFLDRFIDEKYWRDFRS